jgi:hypothetical protein
MGHRVRLLSASLCIVFLGLVAFWADTDTMPAILRAVYHFPNGDRVGHFVLYGIWAGLTIWAWPRVGAIVATGIAVAEELSQLWMAHRTADWLDLGCGLAGILTAQACHIAWRLPSQGRRSRLWHAGWIAMVVVVGLGSRSALLRSWVPLGVGDALWAVAVFLGCGWLCPARSIGRIAVLALLLSWAVEFSQLWHAPWLDGLRQEWWGALVLGRGFLWTDLVWYAGGVGLAALVEWMVLCRWSGRFVPGCASERCG